MSETPYSGIWNMNPTCYTCSYFLLNSMVGHSDAVVSTTAP